MNTRAAAPATIEESEMVDRLANGLVKEWKLVAAVLSMIVAGALFWNDTADHQALDAHKGANIRLKVVERTQIKQELKLEHQQREIENLSEHPPGMDVLKNQLETLKESIIEIKDSLKDLKKLSEARRAGKASAVARRPMVDLSPLPYSTRESVISRLMEDHWNNQ